MAEEVKVLGDEYPELYHHLAAIVVEACQGLGLGVDQAASIAKDVANQFRNDFGGDSLYIPKMASAGYEEIYRRWNAGADARELAREYKYSLPHINLIVRQMKQRSQRQQKGLFDGLDLTGSA